MARLCPQRAMWRRAVGVAQLDGSARTTNRRCSHAVIPGETHIEHPASPSIESVESHSPGRVSQGDSPTADPLGPRAHLDLGT
jgi:hypothetical protein